jgi:hypothetical protein
LGDERIKGVANEWLGVSSCLFVYLSVVLCVGFFIFFSAASLPSLWLLAKKPESITTQGKDAHFLKGTFKRLRFACSFNTLFLKVVPLNGYTRTKSVYSERNELQI